MRGEAAGWAVLRLRSAISCPDSMRMPCLDDGRQQRRQPFSREGRRAAQAATASCSNNLCACCRVLRAGALMRPRSWSAVALLIAAVLTLGGCKIVSDADQARLRQE